MVSNVWGVLNFVKSRKKPSELISVVLIFMTATQTNEWRCAHCAYSAYAKHLYDRARPLGSAPSDKSWPHLKQHSLFALYWTDSLLNRCTAAQTPLTLPYWATSTFCSNVEERYRHRFFFWPAATSFTSARTLKETVQDRRPLESRSNEDTISRHLHHSR